MVSIGITPWGIVEKRNELVGKKMDVPFHSVAQPRSVGQTSTFSGKAVERSDFSGLCRKFSQLVFRSVRFRECALLGANSIDQ